MILGKEKFNDMANITMNAHVQLNIIKEYLGGRLYDVNWANNYEQKTQPKNYISAMNGQWTTYGRQWGMATVSLKLSTKKYKSDDVVLTSIWSNSGTNLGIKLSLKIQMYKNIIKIQNYNHWNSL